MPIYESACRACGDAREWYAPLSTSPDPDCCGQPMSRLISVFHVVFTGPITARYNDKKLEGSHKEGFTAWRVHSAKDPRCPEPVHITSFSDRKQFMKDEGLEEVPSNATISGVGEDGQGVKVSTVGEPGCWV